MNDVHTHSQSDIGIAALVKGQERYIVLYHSNNVGPAYRALGKWVANPELSFSWQDAGTMFAEISENVRELKAP